MTEKLRKEKIDPNKIEKGHLMAIVNFVKVENVVRRGESIEVIDVDDKNKGILVEGGKILEGILSADTYGKTIETTRTEMAHILSTSYNKPFSVEFITTKGERKLRGRLLGPDDGMGRSRVEDLDVTADTPLRLVDHRTLNSLIVDGIRYHVKPGDRAKPKAKRSKVKL